MLQLGTSIFFFSFSTQTSNDGTAHNLQTESGTVRCILAETVHWLNSASLICWASPHRARASQD